MRRSERLQVALMLRLERKYEGAIYSVKRNALPLMDAEAIQQQVQADMLPILTEIYMVAAQNFGQMVLDSLSDKKAYASKRGPDRWFFLADQWLHQHGLRQAKEISETTAKDFSKILKGALEEGLGTDATARRIDGQYNAIGRYRSKVIARTEIHNAAMYVSKETAEDYSQATGISVKKKWVSVEDVRTRPDHAAMDSREPIDMDGKFNVGGYMMDRPGDPNGPASQVINCRCVMRYVDSFDDLFDVE